MNVQSAAEQGGVAPNGEDSDTGSGMSGVTEQSGNDTGTSDLLTALERRWDAMAGLIRDLRDETGMLRNQLQERDQQATRRDAEAVVLKEQLSQLDEEKKRTILRLEGMLAKFDDPSL